MSQSLRTLLWRTFQKAEVFFPEGSLYVDSCRAAHNRVRLIVDGTDTLFVNDQVKGRAVGLLRAALNQSKSWPPELGFVVDEFVDMIEEVEAAPVLDQVKSPAV